MTMYSKLPACLVALGLLTAVLPGCGNKIKGSVDEEKVKASNGFYAQDERGAIYVILTPIANACENYVELSEQAEDVDDAAGYAELWAENRPADFWELSILMFTDPGDDHTDDELDGVNTDSFFEEDSAQIYMTHYLQHLDEAYFDGSGDDSDYTKNYISDGGTLTFGKYDEDNAFDATFETTMQNEDLDDVGEVTVKFKVERCEDYEDYVF